MGGRFSAGLRRGPGPFLQLQKAKAGGGRAADWTRVIPLPPSPSYRRMAGHGCRNTSSSSLVLWMVIINKQANQEGQS